MIGIICAMDTEVNGYIEEMKNKKTETVSGYAFTRGLLNGVDAVVVMCGIGKVNAAICTQTMIMKYNPEYIINSGIGGGITSDTEIGDIVIGESVIQHDMDTTAFGDPKGLLDLPNGNRTELYCSEKLITCAQSICQRLGIRCHTGKIVTGDQFITKKQKRIELSEEFGAIICEMEGGSVGQTCYRADIPFIIIRAVSDNIEKSNHMDYLEFKKQCSELSAKIVIALLSEVK